MNENQVALIFGKRLKELRLEKSLSQEKLAHQAGLHRTYISLLEKGKRQPSLSSAMNLADALGIKLAYLLTPFLN